MKQRKGSIRIAALVLAVVIIAPTLLWGQSLSSTAKRLRRAAALPSTCQIGEVFFDDDATAGSNVFGCTAANTWTVQGVSGGSVGTTTIKPGNTKVTSSSVLTINDGCSSGDPCNVRVGSTTYSFTGSATATITAGSGSGTAKVFVTSGGVVTVQTPTAAGLTVTCTSCTHAQVTTPAFPANGIPLYDVTITSGAWTAVTDLRSFIGGGVGNGGMILLETQTVSGAASMNFTSCLSSSYDVYRVFLEEVMPGTDAVNIYLRFSDNGGSTYIAGTSYTWAIWNTNIATGTSGSQKGAGVSGIELGHGSTVPNTGTIPLSQELTFSGVNSTSDQKVVRGNGLAVFAGDSGTYGGVLYGALNDVDAMNAFQFIASSGTITGTGYCYALAK